MPQYVVTAPDGRKLRLTGDAPPTDTDLDEIFSQKVESPTQPTPVQAPKSIMEKSIRSTLPSALPAGISTAVDTIANKPETLPAIGQSLGSRFGLKGSVGGAMLGQAGKQASEFLQGGPKPDIGEVGREGLTTGAIEGVTRGLGAGIFRRQYANKSLQELGKKLGEMKKAFGENKAISVPAEQIYMKLKGAMDDVAVASGPQSATIKRWLGFMEKNPNLTSKNLMELESDLGEVANYGVMKKGAFVQPSNIKKPVVNAIAKEGRKDVSNLVDDLAEQSGQKGFGKTSEELRKMISEGILPADKAFQMIIGGLEKDLAGAAQRAAGSWQGLTSSMQDLVKVNLREFFTGTAQAQERIFRRPLLPG